MYTQNPIEIKCPVVTNSGIIKDTDVVNIPSDTEYEEKPLNDELVLVNFILSESITISIVFNQTMLKQLKALPTSIDGPIVVSATLTHEQEKKAVSLLRDLK